MTPTAGPIRPTARLKRQDADHVGEDIQKSVHGAVSFAVTRLPLALSFKRV